MIVDELEERGYCDVVKVAVGGLGDVFRATRISTGGDVAIKVVREVGDRVATERRVRRELSALLKLKGHPNVVQIEELIELPTGLALVMEFMGGGSLMESLELEGRFSPHRTIRVMTDVARALTDAHTLNIVHRDVKPHNIMLGQFGQHKVCDFGIAAILKDAGYTDRTSALSYRYASPEEIEDASEIGPATDIYSLGVTLRQLLSTETNEARAGQIIDDRRHDNRLSVAERTIVASLGRLVDQMTARDASTRPSAKVVLEAVLQMERSLAAEQALPDEITSDQNQQLQRLLVERVGNQGAQVVAEPAAALTHLIEVDDSSTVLRSREAQSKALVRPERVAPSRSRPEGRRSKSKVPRTSIKVAGTLLVLAAGIGLIVRQSASHTSAEESGIASTPTPVPTPAPVSTSSESSRVHLRPIHNCDFSPSDQPVSSTTIVHGVIDQGGNSRAVHARPSTVPGPTTTDNAPTTTLPDVYGYVLEDMPTIDGRQVCSVGPSAGGSPFERGTAKAGPSGTLSYWEVTVGLNPDTAGTDDWEALVAACYVGAKHCPTQQLAVELDDKILMIDKVNAAKLGGRIIISYLPQAEAEALAKNLNQ